MRTVINRDSISNAKLKATICQLDTILLALARIQKDSIDYYHEGTKIDAFNPYTNANDIKNLRKPFLSVLKLVNSFDEKKLKQPQAEIDKFFQENSGIIDHKTESLLSNDKILAKIQKHLDMVIEATHLYL